MTHYTLVQHSAWVVNQDPTFERAVESTSITEKQAQLVVENQGLLFDDYDDADEAEMLVNYPAKEYTGLVPRAHGVFKHIPKLHISLYIPTRLDKENLEKVKA